MGGGFEKVVDGGCLEFGRGASFDITLCFALRWRVADYCLSRRWFVISISLCAMEEEYHAAATPSIA